MRLYKRDAKVFSFEDFLKALNKCGTMADLEPYDDLIRCLEKYLGVAEAE